MIRRQDKHYALYSKPRIQLMEEFSYKHLLLLPNPIQKTINVMSIQEEVGGLCKTHEMNEENMSFEHHRDINKLFVSLCDQT